MQKIIRLAEHMHFQLSSSTPIGTMCNVVQHVRFLTQPNSVWNLTPTLIETLFSRKNHAHNLNLTSKGV